MADGFKWFMDGNLAELMGTVPEDVQEELSKYFPKDMLKAGFKKNV